MAGLEEESDHVVVGEIVKVRGIQGEVVVRPLSDVADRFDKLTEVLIVDSDGGVTTHAITSSRQLQREYLMRFADIHDRQEAKNRLVGRLLAVSSRDVPPPAPDENYHFELIGLEVVRTDGVTVGRLESIIETGANDVYVVRGAGGEVLIPAIREVVVGVDVAAGRMTVHPLPGLFEDEPAASESAADGSEAGR